MSGRHKEARLCFQIVHSPNGPTERDPIHLLLRLGRAEQERGQRRGAVRGGDVVPAEIVKLTCAAGPMVCFESQLLHLLSCPCGTPNVVQAEWCQLNGSMIGC